MRGEKSQINTNFVFAEVTTITTQKYGKVDTNIQEFAYCTNIELTPKNLVSVIETGRSRWKIENENFNTMKNHGYNLTHNFGHGKKTLGSIFVVAAYIAFNLQILLRLLVPSWRKAFNSYPTFKLF